MVAGSVPFYPSEGWNSTSDNSLNQTVLTPKKSLPKTQQLTMAYCSGFTVPITQRMVCPA